MQGDQQGFYAVVESQTHHHRFLSFQTRARAHDCLSYSAIHYGSSLCLSACRWESLTCTALSHYCNQYKINQSINNFFCSGVNNPLTQVNCKVHYSGNGRRIAETESFQLTHFVKVVVIVAKCSSI